MDDWRSKAMEDKKVLFVDDQAEILTLIKRMLKDEPYTKYFVSSATEALALMEKQPIDVLVTDMLMPDMSGLELLEMIKTQYPETVKIVLSGYSQVSSILAAINSGDVYRFITKPWKIDEASKKIIRDAIAYSDYLKNISGCMIDASLLSIPLEKLEELLKMVGKDYALVKDGRIVLRSPTITDEHLIEDQNLFNKISLNAYWDVYIKTKS